MGQKTRILADRNIPGITEACAGLGRVDLFDSRDRAGLRRALRTADALLCRSTIQVDHALLAGTPVRFVATATAGFDHVDTNALERDGIAFASAPGSNARSVAEYVAAALFEVCVARGRDLRGLRVGIVGVGEVGSRVAGIVAALGMVPVLNDPPLQARSGDARFVSLQDALSCDIVTLHVPLTADGPWPTRGMIGGEALARMSEGAVLLNTARGGVVHPDAMLRARGRLGALVLDVFPGEPAVEPALVSAADLATPHIAGHAFDGKLRGTAMVRDALARFLGAGGTWDPACVAPPPPVVEVPEGGHTAQVLAVLRAVSDLPRDDADLRAAMQLPVRERGARFAELRSDYRVRREFAAVRLAGASPGTDAARMLRALGFPPSGENV